MFGVITALLIVVPFVELIVIIQVADGIGLLPTVLLLIAISVLGAWLLGQQGVATWRRLRSTLQRGEMPTEEVTDGALILFGGALLLTPGFVTDAFGLALLFPPTRGFVKGSFKRFLSVVAVKRFGWKGAAAMGGKRAHDVRVTNVRRHERDPGEPRPGSVPPELPPTSPSSTHRDGAAGSPDRG